MGWVLDRAKEKSTWLGLLSLIGALGLKVSPEMAEQLVQLALVVTGMVQIFKKERKW